MNALLTAAAEPTLRRPNFAPSKFAVPEASASWVSRPALLAQLGAGDPLSVVVGSPGSGKSSLLAQWAHSQGPGSVAWVNCDHADIDPVRFWHAVIAAARAVRPDFAADCLDMLALNDEVDQDLLESLLSACESLDGRVAIVVDDFQLAGPAVHDDVRFLVARGLGGARLLVGARSEPSLGLDRLRLGDRLCEIRDLDLRFSPADAARLLTRVGVEVGPAELAMILDRTEGWAAGLQLAAIALRDSDHRDDFVAGMDASSRLIAHYLWSEVFEAQPDDVRRFLIDTCVVDELSPPLAAALSPGTAVTLDDIESASLMLVRLDRGGRAFRYHHLLAEMLRHRLRATDPEREQTLHARAAGWYAEHGDQAAAFRHRWRAGQRTAAITTMHGTVIDAYHDGALPNFDDGDRSLTDDDLTAVPGPSVSYCTALLTRGFAEDAERLASRIEVVAGDALQPADRRQLGTVRCLAALALGDTRAAIRHGAALVAEQSGVSADDEWIALGLNGSGRALAWQGEHEDARALLDSCRRLRPESRTAQLESRGTRAFCDLMAGRLSAALAVADESTHELALADLADTDVGLQPASIAGSVALDRGRLAEASHTLGRVSDTDSHLRIPARVLAKIGLSRIARADGDHDAAFAILDDALHLLRRRPADSAIVAHIRAHQASVLTDSGEVSSARLLVDQLPRGFMRSLAIVRMAIADGRPDAARAELDVLATDARTLRQQLEHRLACVQLAASCDQPLGDLAVDVIEVSAPERFVFPIAEAGSIVLDAVRGAARRLPTSAYTDALMTARPCAPPSSAARPRWTFESLTERERAVLRCLATSMTYNEIAGSLGVSVNTIKTHTKNVMRKLQVTTRAETLIRARELRYL